MIYDGEGPVTSLDSSCSVIRKRCKYRSTDVAEHRWLLTVLPVLHSQTYTHAPVTGGHLNQSAYGRRGEAMGDAAFCKTLRRHRKKALALQVERHFALLLLRNVGGVTTPFRPSPRI